MNTPLNFSYGAGPVQLHQAGVVLESEPRRTKKEIQTTVEFIMSAHLAA